MSTWRQGLAPERKKALNFCAKHFNLDIWQKVTTRFVEKTTIVEIVALCLHLLTNVTTFAELTDDRKSESGSYSALLPQSSFNTDFKLTSKSAKQCKKRIFQNLLNFNKSLKKKIFLKNWIEFNQFLIKNKCELSELHNACNNSILLSFFKKE